MSSFEIGFSCRAAFTRLSFAGILASVASGACSTSRAPTEATDAGRSVQDHQDARCPAKGFVAESGTQIELAAPTGPFGVARGARRTVVDPTRDEPGPHPAAGLDAGAGPAAKRKISIEISYPTELCHTGTAVPYWDDIEGTTHEPEGVRSLPSLWWSTVRTHTKSGVPMIADGQRHPVLLFSPGWDDLPRAYTSFIEELVSHGYVVVSVSHTYWVALTVFADGSTVAGPKADYNPSDLEAGIWLADQKLVLDTLPAIDANDEDGKLTARLDLGRIGAFGHSFGGATALNLVAHDPRAKAGVNFDGALAGPDHASGGAVIGRPFVLFESGRAHGASELFIETFDKATGPAFSFVLAGSMHDNFSDYASLATQIGGTLDPSVYGAINPARSISVIEAYLVAFFDQYLAGTTQPLLSGPSADYPEIVFNKRP